MKFYILLFVTLIFVGGSLSDNADEFEVEPEATQSDVKSDLPPVDDFPYTSPVPSDPSRVYLAEHFDDESQFHKLWVKSQAKKEGISEDIAKYDGEWEIGVPEREGLANDKGLILKSKAKHAAISSRLTKPFVFNSKPLIVQYEVTFQKGQDCGGAYLKLLSDGIDSRNLIQFHDKTPYTIMFGPDKCGTDHKLHFIFRHKNPKNGTVEEKHCKKPKDRFDEIFTDHLPHLFTLKLQPDNTYEVLIDKKVFNSGSLFEDFTPPVNPPAEINDPADRKPDDWDDREKIPDPEAVKPEDWDEDAAAQIIDENASMPDGWLEHEPLTIPDVKAEKPADWDNEIDGEWEPPQIENPVCANAVGCGKWEPPMINNPEYKGKWKAPLVDNPNYKGKWRPKTIQNPDYYEDKHPFKMHTISAVGFELWSMSEDIMFDNIIITDSTESAEEWASETYDKKRAKITKAGESVFERVAALTNDYPALWGFYIVVLAVPVVLLLYVCCRATPVQDQEESRRAAAAKKTDEVTADDDVIREMAPEIPEDDEDKEKYSGDDDEDEDAPEGAGDAPEDVKEGESKDNEVSKDEPVRKRKARKE